VKSGLNGTILRWVSAAAVVLLGSVAIVIFRVGLWGGTEKQFATTSRVDGLEWHPNGDALYVACDNGAVGLLNLHTGRNALLFTVPTEPFRTRMELGLSRNGNMLAVASSLSPKGITLWDGIQQQKINNNHPTEPLTSLLLSPDGRLLAAGSYNHLRVWDTVNCSMLWSAETTLSTPALSPDGKLIAGEAPEDREHGGITLWHAATGEKHIHLKGRPLSVGSGLAFSPDGRYIVCNAGGSRLYLFDLLERRFISFDNNPRYTIGYSGSFSPKGDVLLIDHTDVRDSAWLELWDFPGLESREIRKWRVKNTGTKRTEGGFSGWTFARISPNGYRIAVGYDRLIRVFPLPRKYRHQD